MTRADLIVIGAGPAGAAAAIEASEHGLDVILLDEAPAAGGQVFKALPGEFVPDQQRRSEAFPEGEALRAGVAASRVRHMPGHTVWLITGRYCVQTMNREGRHSYQSERLVIATGTHERVLPFPGWTLPGVIGLGAATLMLKSQQVLPGHRTVVAGCGPLLPLVAASILKAGGELAAYVDLNGASDFARALPDLAVRPRRLWQAAAWMAAIRRRGTPMLFRHAVVEALGADAVEQVRIACVGANGREAVVVAADSLAIAYGLVPSTEATRLLGAAHTYDLDLGAWRPTIQEIVRTSLPGLYVAGDVAGVAGAPAAALRGRLAGLAAAIDSGRSLPAAVEDRGSRWRRDLLREDRFARGLGAMMRVPPDLYGAITSETIVCRCEDVTRREIEAAIASGAKEEGEIKAWTRCGMGPCQGRMCCDSVSAILSASTGGPLSRGSWTARPPLRPVPLDLLTGNFEYGDIRMPGPAPS